MQFGRATSWTSARLIGAIVIASVVVLAGCGSSDSGSSNGGSSSTTKPPIKTTTTSGGISGAKQDTALVGKAFTSTSVKGYDLVAGAKIEMAFDADRLSVNAGCNSMGSDYLFTGTELTWTSTPAATMMACPDDLMAQDAWITGLLTAGMGAKLDGDTLTLTSGDVTIVLASSPDAPLVGTAWTLTGTVSGGAVASVPAGVKPPTLTIGKDGTAQIFTGCNSGSSMVKVGDGTLTFGPVVTTKMYCGGAAGELEHQVVSVLDGKVTYVDDGTTLTVSNGDQGLVYTAGS